MPDSSRGRTKLPPTQKLGWLTSRYPMLRLHRLEFLQQQANLGDISHFRMGPYTIYFINHPDLIRDVLVVNAHKFIKGRALQRSRSLLGNGLLTNEGASHLRQRRMIQPAFHKARMAEYARVMTEYAQETTRGWAGGDEIDTDREMMRLTLRIVAKTLFGADVTAETDEVGAALTTLVDMFNLLLLPFSEYLEKLPLPHSLRLKRARRTLDAVMYRIIEERRLSGADTGDLLSMLLQARDEDDGGKMTYEQVRDEALTLFLAGHETTANALTWTWYLLSQNPDVEAEFHDEIDRVLAGRSPTADDVPALSYTEHVLAESMRLYPPVWGLGRQSVEDHELAGYEIPAGSTVLMSQYVIQNDSRFWDEPGRFIPGRWQDQSVKEAGQKYIYFPFGSGIRRCIGEGFAWTEGILLLVTLGQRCRFRLDPNQEIATKPLITLRPKYGMRMVLERRERV